MLDATPLAHRYPDPLDLRRLDGLISARIPVMIPEVADFEVRRSLLLHDLRSSLQELELLKSRLIYVPISTAAMLRAAEFWADSRRRGQPTADPKELDCDAILAAQASLLGAVVVTENVGHLSQYVQTKQWRRLSTR